MALIRCPDCKERISDHAPRCPHCGRPIADERKSQLQIRLLLTVVLLAGAYAFWIYTRDVPEPAPTTETAPSAESGPRSEPPPVPNDPPAPQAQPPAETPPPASAPRTRPLIQRPVPPGARRLMPGLLRLPGEFTRTDDGWRFSDPEHTLFHMLALAGDSAVVTLIDCLTRTEPATATLDGEPVTLGVMCYEALRYVADPYPRDGDFDWPGHVEPTASPEELRMAQRAWRDLIVIDRYRLRHAPVPQPRRR